MKKCHEVLPKMSRSLSLKCHELLPEKLGKGVTELIKKMSQYYGCIFIRKNKPSMRDKQYRKIPSEVLALGLGFRAGLRDVIFSSAAKWPGIRT